MPNIKSAIKRVKQSAAANEQNSNTKHAMRTAVRKAETALDAKDENATGLLRDAIKKWIQLHVKALSINICITSKSTSY